MPELPAEPKDIEPPPKTIDKLEVMSRNCDELKRTLAQLQGQMSVMTDKQKTELNAAGPSNNKKTKNKKSKPKPATTKPSVETSAVNEKTAAAVEPATPAKSPEANIDQPLAELVTKVLAENPPPIELLESVLTSEVLADILNKEQDQDNGNHDEQQNDDGSSNAEAEETANESVNESAEGDNEPDQVSASNDTSA